MITSAPGLTPINLIYSVKDVSDSDIDYFINSFDIRDKKLRENYLKVKETLMGLSYRFSHYTPLDTDNYKQKQVEMLLLKWENWFMKAVEASKGVKSLKVLYLRKKQYAVCGLELPRTRKKELVAGYQNLIYQTEVNEKERQGIITEMEAFRSKIVGSYPGEFQENLRKFDKGENRRLLNGGLNILESPAYFSWKPLTEREKLEMVTFMEQSYKQFGGTDLGKYNKNIRQNMIDLESLKNYSQLEMSRNIFDPKKSKFLTGEDYRDQIKPDQDYLINSKHLVQSAKSNIDLSKSISHFIEAERTRESRNETMGREVRNIVSYLQDNDVEAERLHDISQLLIDDGAEDVPNNERRKQKEKELKGILKNKGKKGVSKESSKKSSKRDKKSGKSKDRKKKEKKDKKSRKGSKSKDRKKKEKKSKSKDKKGKRSKSRGKSEKKSKKDKSKGKEKKKKSKSKDKKKRSKSKKKK